MKSKKTKKANLENKRVFFFQVGLIVTLSIVLLAFEWTTIQSHTIDLNLFDRGELIEELAEVTIHKKKQLEMPKPKLIPTIEVVDNETDVNEEIDISSEITDETTNDLEMEFEDDLEEQIEEIPIFKVVEENPEFPGGDAALLKFLADKINYPRIARDAGIQGTVYITFIVFEDGSIRDIGIKRGIGGGCDKEALRVVNLMPKWNPGKQRNKAVRVQMILPVKFSLIN